MLTAMKFHSILQFTLVLALGQLCINSETVLPNVCEQLRSDPNVGILSLAIVPIRRQLLLLTTNLFAIEVDFYRKFTYPSEVGYPDFRPLTFMEKWTVEIISGDESVFDVLSAEERQQWKLSFSNNQSVVLPTTGLLIHNESMSTYYVTEEEEEGSALNGSKKAEGRTFVWRALKRGAKVRRVTSDQPVEQTVCVSAQEPSRGYSLAVAEDGRRCFQRTDFYAGQSDQYVNVISYSPHCQASGAVRLCGALINELLFAVNNAAKTVTIYQDPILSNRTERIQTVPFTEFFSCSSKLFSSSELVNIGALVVVSLIILVVAVIWVKKCFRFCMRKRRPGRTRGYY